MRRVVVTILGCLLFSLSVVAQSYFKDVTVRKGKDFSFHIFSAAGQRRAVRRINLLLQLSELYEIPRNPFSRKIFDQSEANDGSIYGGKNSIDETVYSNTPRILSIAFVESSSGATSHYWNAYYNFNPANGDRIELKDLFTPTGYEKFSKRVLGVRSSRFRREVSRKIEKQFQQEYLDSVIQPCFAAGDALDDFYISGGRITFDGDGCLAKNQKFDGLEMKVTFAPRMFTQYLNAYGRSIFGLSNADLSGFHSQELPQLLEGRVGPYPVAMILSPQPENEYWGMYAYLKHGEGIALRGTRENDELKLDEYILAEQATNGPLGSVRKVEKKGNLSGNIVDGAFRGTWSGAERHQQLRFELGTR